MSSYVYFLEADNGYTKIGVSTNVDRRVAQILSTLRNIPGRAVRARVVAILPGDRRVEADVHRRIRHARRCGEWFETKAVRVLLAELPGVEMLPENPNGITPRQLGIAMGGERMSNRALVDALGERGLSVRVETIGRIRAGSSPGRRKTMRALKEFFEELGYEFSARNSHVCVCAPADE